MIEGIDAYTLRLVLGSFLIIGSLVVWAVLRFGLEP
jgi:hypothetical protein